MSTLLGDRSLRRLHMVLGLALLSLVLAPAPAVAKRGGTDRPVSGSGTGTTTANLATGAGTGTETTTISHLGRSTLTENDVSTLTGPTTFSFTGTTTFVAANGDELFATDRGSGTITGFAVGATLDVTPVYTITGGTGRFADASGTLTAPTHSVVISLAGATLVTQDTFTVQGRISY